MENIEKSFDVKEVISFGWTKFKEQWKFLSLALLATIVAVGITQALTEIDTGFKFVFVFAGIAVQIIIALAWITIYLKLADGGTASWNDFTENLFLWWKYLLAGILYNIIVAIGFVLFIVPGVYFAVKYQFFVFALVDKKEIGIWESFEESARLTNGVKWELFWLWFIFLGIALIGLLFIGIGVFVAGVVIGVATATIYRMLQKQSSE